MRLALLRSSSAALYTSQHNPSHSSSVRVCLRVGYSRNRYVLVGFLAVVGFSRLDMLLLLAVLLEDAQRSTAGCAHKIRVRPQGWQFPFEHRKFLAQQTRRTPFDQFHQPMNAKLGIDTHQQVNMIGHDFQFLDLCLMFLANLPDDFLQASLDGLHQNPPPLFRTPNHMVVASVAYVPVAFVGLDHMFQYTAACYLLSRADVLDRHCPGSLAPIKERAFHPPGLSTGAFRRGFR